MFKWKIMFSMIVVLCLLVSLLHIPIVWLASIYPAPVRWHFSTVAGNIFSGHAALLFSPRPSKLLYQYKHTEPFCIVFKDMRWRFRSDLISLRDNIWAAWQFDSPYFSQPVILKWQKKTWVIDHLSGHWPIDRLLYMGGIFSTLLLKGELTFTFDHVVLNDLSTDGQLKILDLETGLIPHYVMGDYSINIQAHNGWFTFDLSSSANTTVLLEGKGSGSTTQFNFEGSVTPLKHLNVLKPILKGLIGGVPEKNRFPMAIHI